MTDETVLEAPANTPASEVNEPAVPAGIEGAMKEFEQLTAPKPKPDASPKKEEPTPKAEPKTEPKSEPKSDAKVDPKEKPEDLWSKAPPKLKGEHFKTVRQLQDKADSLEKKIKEIESKKVETPADAKLVEQYQKQIQSLEQKIAESDYRQSQEFQKQYTTRINRIYQDAVEEVKALKVNSTDAEGNVTQRAATKEDFDRVFYLQGSAQDEAIAAFGHSAYRVASIVRELNSLTRQSEQALAEHAQNAEKTAKEKELEKQRSEGEYKQHYDASVAQLEQGWPQYFAPDDKDPDATAALQQGYKFVDDVLANAESLKPDERAAKNAVIRARAAGFVRAIVENNRLKADLESMKAELSKFRKSDPGATDGDRGAATSSGEEEVPAGIDAATKAFANLR